MGCGSGMGGAMGPKIEEGNKSGRKVFCVKFQKEMPGLDEVPFDTHPLGQRLIVTSGCGWVLCRGGAKREIRAGDVVVCPPGEKHWHGATTTTGMSHIAIQEALDGKVVEWLEKVTDEEYLAGAHPE